MIGKAYTEREVELIAEDRLHDEIVSGIQTIQYQINTFSTTNGQAPFLSVFMYISEEPEYEKETAMLIEEMLRQRYEGMKNPVGAYVTPAFPKLLYVLDENNVPKDSRYRYLTDLAVKCVAKRMMPDFISAKIMKKNYKGEVFPCMGCRSFLAPWKDEEGNYKWYGRFNQGVVTINLADVGLSAEQDMEKFWNILDERLSLCREALMLRHESLKGTLSDVSPIHWQFGAIARLKPGETIDKLLEGGYSTLSSDTSVCTSAFFPFSEKAIRQRMGTNWLSGSWSASGEHVTGGKQSPDSDSACTELRQSLRLIHLREA